MKDLYGKKEKHDHKFSNLLKGCILAIVMLAPFFAILSKIIYVSANKNAKDSYFGETINEQENVKIDYTNLQNDKTYIFNNLVNNQKTDEYGTVNYLYMQDVKNLNGFNNNVNLTNTYRARIYLNNTYNALELQDAQGNMITSFNMFQLNAQFSFTYKGVQGNLNVLSYYNYFYQIEYNKNSYLDNAFYYAIDQSKNEEILDWTKDTPIYNVINTMNTGLGLSNNHILTYLLTYWSIILAIYIVFDIIIFIFTKITHYLQ